MNAHPLRSMSMAAAARSFLVVGLLLFVGVTVSVLSGRVDEVDRAVHVAAAGRWPGLVGLMLGVSLVGAPSVLAVLSLGLIAALWHVHRRRDGAKVAAVMIGAMVTGASLKLAFARPRPEPFYGLPTPATWAYPSGHALGAVCFFGVLALCVSPSVQGARRAAVWAGCAVVAGLIGASRIFLGVHWASDVLGGWLAGMVWVSAVELAFSGWGDASRDRNPRDGDGIPQATEESS